MKALNCHRRAAKASKAVDHRQQQCQYLMWPSLTFFFYAIMKGGVSGSVGAGPVFSMLCWIVVNVMV